jgi:hypothetical protein
MAQGFTRGTPIDTDPNLALDSDLVVPSQKAIKDYVDTGLNTKQDTLTLTTTGTSGAATLIGATLNIPQYSGGGPGGDSIASLSNSSGDVSAAASAPSQLNVVATLRTNLKTGSCGVTFDGQGGTISNGKTAYVQVPYNGTLTSWTLVANALGSCTVTVFKDTFAFFPPTTPTDDIYSIQPALASQQKNQNLTPTYVGSQATVTAGDYIGFTISGVTTVSWVNLTISITKT